MIRPAVLADVNAIIDIAMVQTEMYSMLKPDREKIRKGIVLSISSAKHFCWVSEAAGKVSGALVAVSSDNLWAQRQNCLVALWVASVVGDGRKMLKEFLKWVDSRRIIRVAGFVPDTDEIDSRAWRLIERFGFRRCGGVHLLYN
jgi:hypothetical protein